MNGPAPQIAWLSAGDPPWAFPDIARALAEPDGLLAAGGDLSPERLLYAYRHGIFPWYDDGQPILWWSPDPRCVLPPHEFHLAKRLRRDIRQSTFEISFNTAFSQVMRACAGRRTGQRGTWITPDMARAYSGLHDSGWAHSIEVWDGDQLAGGLYGIAIGRVFFGESMFSRESNASKIAMLALCREMALQDFALLDCQVVSPHLLTLGAREMSRAAFRDILDNACEPRQRGTKWPAGRMPAAALAAR